MFEELAPVGSGHSLVYFGEKPFVVSQRALYGLGNKRRAVSTLLLGHFGKFRLQVWRQGNFHISEGRNAHSRRQPVFPFLR